MLLARPPPSARRSPRAAVRQPLRSSCMRKSLRTDRPAAPSMCTTLRSCAASRQPPCMRRSSRAALRLPRCHPFTDRRASHRPPRAHPAPPSGSASCPRARTLARCACRMPAVRHDPRADVWVSRRTLRAPRHAQPTPLRRCPRPLRVRFPAARAALAPSCARRFSACIATARGVPARCRARRRRAPTNPPLTPNTLSRAQARPMAISRCSASAICCAPGPTAAPRNPPWPALTARRI